MYQDFYGFQQKPFALTPNTELFVNQQSHREALNTLLLALRYNEGFIKIVGEVGTGKTLLCRKLLSLLNNQFITVYIPDPSLEPAELRCLVAQELGVEITPEQPSYTVTSQLYHRLMVLARERRQVVLVIDEAQAMPRDTLDTLRLLTNLETEQRKLLQVVMLGQPELDTLLNRPDLRQLRQRIVFSEYLRPFTAPATAHYVRQRLRAAGCQRELFSSATLRLLAVASNGTPRVINILAHKSLLAAYGKGAAQVDARHVMKAVADTEESHRYSRWLRWRWRFLSPVLATSAALMALRPGDLLRGVL